MSELNRIDGKFAELKEQRKTAFIPFITIGDPNLDTSVDIILELERAGAHIIELGVPYSDPLADGPVIQRSSQRALQAYPVTIDDVIGTARLARERGSRIPFVLFTYFNPVLQAGIEKTMEKLKDGSISGLIIPDLPMEEDEQTREYAQKHGIHLIPLVAPTSQERIRKIVSRASGFVYCVSSLGVTGTRTQFHEGIDGFLRTVKEATDLPIAIGFGISNHEQFQRFAQICDGVVVGSALVRTIEEALPKLASQSDKAQGLADIHRYVQELIG